MKLFKNTKAFFAAALLVAGLSFIACSTPASDKTDTGGAAGGTGSSSTGGSINANDGNAIAYFICDKLCDDDDETVKLCFYEGGVVKLRATSLDDDDDKYGQRYDKLRGTYTGDPTKKNADGIVVNFTEKGYWDIDVDINENDYSSEEEFYAAMSNIQMKWKISYKKYNGTANWTGTITDDVLRFSKGDYKYSESWSGSSYEFIRTTASDLGPYQYDGVDRRQNDNTRTSWKIPEGYTSIAESCFHRKWTGEEDYYQYLEKVTLPSTIKKIGDKAFYNCTGLKEVNIPEGCTEIGDGAFYNCISLEKITIPSTIEKIGSYAFSKKPSNSSTDEEEENILDVVFANGTTKIPESSFDSYTYKSEVKSVKLPSSVKEIGKKAFYCFKFDDSFVLPQGVEEIKDYAFYNAKMSFAEMTLPSNLKKIGNYALYNVAAEKIEVPEGVEEIGDYAFYYSPNSSNDKSLKELVLPSTLKSLGSSAFYYNKLETLQFGGTIFELQPLLNNIYLYNNSDIKIMCGEADVTDFCKGGLDYHLSNSQWENDEAAILLTLKEDKSFTKKTGSKIENGLWITNTSSTPYTITVYKKGEEPKEYEYSVDYYSLKISGLADYTPVKEYTVIEKKEVTTEKWCDDAKFENGQYVYYQYYLEKVADSSNYFKYINTPVYYRYENPDTYDCEYENRYYKSCKDEIENLLNDSYNPKTHSTYNSDTGKYESILYVTSDPQQPQQQEEN